VLELGRARIGYFADHDEALGTFVREAIAHFVHPPSGLLEKLAAMRAGSDDRATRRALLDLATRYAPPGEQPASK
jgi:hypothetical protein